MNLAAPTVTVAVVNDYPLVVSGLARLLAGDERIRVVELVLGTRPMSDADIVLFDAFGCLDRLGDDIADLRRDSGSSSFVVYSWTASDELARAALEAGADGYLSKRLDGTALVEALLRIRAGERVVDSGTVPEGAEPGDWPGSDAGLSAREAEVLALITQGRTNDEIAAQCHLSINSVKTYIRSAYRKIGVERRPEAILWGVDHGFLPPRPWRGTVEA